MKHRDPHQYHLMQEDELRRDPQHRECQEIARAEGRRRRDEGKKQAADHFPTLLETARRIAFRLGMLNDTVTSDDVAHQMGDQLWVMLGNARGSVFSGDLWLKFDDPPKFKTSKWVWTGKMVESTRPSAHGRLIKVWRLR